MKQLSIVMNAYAKEHGYYYIDQGTNPDNPDALIKQPDRKSGKIQMEKWIIWWHL